MSLATFYERLLKNTKMHLPGALDDAVKAEFFNVVDEFFKETNIWQESISVAATSATDTYQISPQDDGTINRLLYVQNASEFAVNATMEEVGVLVLGALPSQNETLTARVALTVIDPVTQSGDLEGWPRCPEWILDKHQSGLFDGVVGRMMAQPAKPYSNERMSIFRMRKFNSAKSIATSESRRKNLYGAQRWAYPRGWV